MAEATTAHYRRGKIDGYTDPLLWAIDTFQRNAYRFKPGGGPAAIVEDVVKALRLGCVYDHYEEGVTLEEWSAKRVTWARQGNKLAAKLLFETAATLIQKDTKLPEALRDFIVEHLRDPDKRIPQRAGRKRHDLADRDDIISFAIGMICMAWGLPATRNDASKGKRDSAASIVCAALKKSVGVNLTEEAVNKIWAGSGPFKAASRVVGKNRRD